jgi:(p)ppGpp synthase/HD superfamily hydrolase
MSAQAQLIAAFVKLIEGPLTLPKAVAIATVCHGNAEDKGKNSYIRHPLRLIEKQETEDEMMVAVLHDVVEDTFLTLNDLEELGFTASQLKILDALTKKPGPDYNHEAYISNIEHSPVATRIKIDDMEDNCRLDRLKSTPLSNRHLAKFNQYLVDLKRLKGRRHR